MEESSTSGIPKPEVKAMEMHRSSSRPQLDVSGAAIQGNFEDRNPTILLPNQSNDISHFCNRHWRILNKDSILLEACGGGVGVGGS